MAVMGLRFASSFQVHTHRQGMGNSPLGQSLQSTSSTALVSNHPEISSFLATTKSLYNDKKGELMV